MGAHLDESLKCRIIVGQCVDFSKLIPRDRIQMESDKRLEIATHNGQTFFQHIVKREGIGIGSIYHWDLPF